VKTAFTSSLSILSAELVEIGQQSALGVVDDIGAELGVAEGGHALERALRVSFPGGAFSPPPRSGRKATCRGLVWQISVVDDSPGSLVIDMIEPERRGV